ncbi:IDEAL domain-containing protein [Lentibacillus sp. Marseille-P4043]|uniref:IDEAL domain-containing protein n=1 Tax=Lentibacillus sp. Marseille-P4043 TaxID=2040293 RepID=UPI000D0BCB02|nr:IDEAL domain-containing protein [Lentibacillus sp. Marseille-P4043]
MKKQKLIYRYYRYEGDMLHAKREIPYELKLSSRLLLDELCFSWNKARLEDAINNAIDEGNKEAFLKWSEAYRHYIWE